MPGSGSGRTITFIRATPRRWAIFTVRCGAPGRGSLILETVGALALIGAVGFGSVAFAAITAVFVVVGAQRDSG